MFVFIVLSQSLKSNQNRLSNGGLPNWAFVGQMYPIAPQAGIVDRPIELLAVRCVRSFPKLALWVARSVRCGYGHKRIDIVNTFSLS